MSTSPGSGCSRSHAGSLSVEIASDDGERREFAALLTQHRRWIEGHLGASIGTVQAGAEEEYADPFGSYRREGATPLLGRVDGRPSGVAVLTPLPGDVVELSRVFVRPQARGGGLGRALVRAAIDQAHAQGARCVLLETHSVWMASAVRLYQDLGFVDVPAYGSTEHPEVRCLALDLAATRVRSAQDTAAEPTQYWVGAPTTALPLRRPHP